MDNPKKPGRWGIYLEPNSAAALRELAATYGAPPSSLAGALVRAALKAGISPDTLPTSWTFRVQPGPRTPRVLKAAK